MSAQQVDTGRQHLAELDEGRAKILHRAAHAHRRRHPQQFLPLLVPVQQAPCPFKRGGQADAPHHVAEAITDQDNGNFLQSAQVTDCAQRFPHHACSGRLPEQHVTAGRRHRAMPPLRFAGGWLRGRRRTGTARRGRNRHGASSRSRHCRPACPGCHRRGRQIGRAHV
ncbi:hypothetical protein G6F68_015980 [Rhizopus microsporus]|nr:hypothetical protein G6F68_015980 [Rhizopus microsporus]